VIGRYAAPPAWSVSPFRWTKEAGMRKSLRMLVVGSVLLSLAGCNDDEKTSNGGSGSGGPIGSNNAPPTIAGIPSSHILEGEFYEFLPVANDKDGDALVFSIARKPVWATFDSGTGRLYGTPGSNHAGNFTNIQISVSDGNSTVALREFDVTVDQIALGSATVSWNPPTDNADGTSLTDLTGYRIYYGRSATALDRTIVLNNPGLTLYVVENLSPARWYFSMTAVNAKGEESARTQPVTKTVT
jgi:hypothetical protein